MMRSAWVPAVILSLGAFLATVGVRAQRSLSLRMPLAASVPRVLQDYTSRDLDLSDAERRAAGVTSYLNRLFVRNDTGGTAPPFFTLYVGYYDRQASGRAIHSPKNCLPGSGWEPLTSSHAQVATSAGPVTVNRYLIQKGRQRALVLYWYQGRGRVEANEYVVKWDLVRDAALRRRSDEALVRIVVMIHSSESEALELATQAAGRVVGGLGSALQP